MKRQIVCLITITIVIVTAIFALPPMLRLTLPTLSLQPNDAATPKHSRASKPKTGGAITLMAVTENQNGFGLLARPVDPATLADLPDCAALNFGHHYTYAVSPDRKMLALLTWPSGSNNAGGTLHLIDLNTWTDTPADLRIDDYVNDLTFSADGKTLYLTMPTLRDSAHGMPRDFQLYAMTSTDASYPPSPSSHHPLCLGLSACPWVR